MVNDGPKVFKGFGFPRLLVVERADSLLLQVAKGRLLTGLMVLVDLIYQSILYSGY